MNTWAGKLWGGLALVTLLSFHATATTFYVDVNSTNPVSPYTDWSTAATNIQDAVDASSAGDLVLVTNGVYQTGQTYLNGSNRVSVTKAVTLQSLNGPEVTIIKGYPIVNHLSTSIRCAYLANGATLNGFTLANGSTSYLQGGGGIYCQSTNCLVTNCIITGNISDGSGGGVDSGTMMNCMLLGNTSSGGGGGAAYSVLINCVVSGNESDDSGGGASGCSLINCTVVNNTSLGGGGGMAGSIAVNCISYYNSPDNGNGSVNASHFTNCCVFPTPIIGLNITTNPPGLVDVMHGNYRLQIGSPCIDAGINIYAPSGIDLDGNPRIFNETVDIGAYESQFAGTVHYASLTSTNPVSPYTEWGTAATNIQDAVAVAQAGEFVVVNDGIYKFGSTTVYGQMANRVALTNPVTLLSLNGAQSTAIVGSVSASQTRCVYVGSNAVMSGFTLANGLTRTSGDAIKERSGGGAWCESGGVISNCVFGGNYFPYANGGSPSDGCSANYQGGGVYGGNIYNCTFELNSAPSGHAAAVANLVNCLITNNIGSGYGGGLYQGTATNCTFNGNSSGFGGGGYQSILFNCILSNNVASGGGTYQCTNYNCLFVNNSGQNGGGISDGISFNCIVSSNTATGSGGGAYHCTLNNCMVISNRASVSGGGVYSASLTNCVLYGNSASSGGGAYQISAYNCTIIDNTATNSGGGVAGGTGAWLNNCIVYYNSAATYPNVIGAKFNNCCTTPGSVGNITNEPAFVDLANGDLHLSSNSPCINAGNNAFVSSANDLDGNPRIQGGTVDIGAYEYQTPASTLSYAWAQQYGLPTDGSADNTDSDGDGLSNWQEWKAGTVPTNAASVLQLASPTNSVSGMVVTWQSVSGITYYLQRSSDLAGGFSSIVSNRVGQAGSTSYTDTSATNDGPYFYRVGVQ